MRSDLVASPGEAIVSQQSTVRQWVLMSGASLLVQVKLTDYGSMDRQSTVFWFLVGASLLWLVYRRRSAVARGFVIVFALWGACLYGLSALNSVHAAVLSLAFLGQALPLMSRSVRAHTRSEFRSPHRREAHMPSHR